MSNEIQVINTRSRTFPATVAEVLGNGSRVIINRGEIDGVKLSQKFLLYQISPKEIIDPETGDSLGYLEIVKGTGFVVHIQERMSILQAEEKSLLATFVKASGQPSKEEARFFNPEVGDKAKPI